VDCPSRVGCGALLGCIKSGFVFASEFLLDGLSCFTREFFPAAALRVMAFDGATPESNPEVLSETLFTFPESSETALASSATSPGPAGGFADFALAVRTAAPFRAVEYKRITSCGGLPTSDAA